MSIPRRMTPRRMNTQKSTMFPHTVTIYNVSVETDKGTIQSRTVNHITVLRGVLLEESKGVNVRESGLEGADAVTLYIPFSVDAVDGVTGAKKRYVPPIEFWRAEDRTDLWTLAISSKETGVDGSTFFIKGEVVEPDAPVERIEMLYDHVYDITKIDAKDFGSPDMQHWEVGGV